MVEFTGERVIPGAVDTDLYNEHLARYAFASRLALGKRVLDAGCGAGYGSAELARIAESVTGIDVSSTAIEYARAHYTRPNLVFEQVSCEQLPFDATSFDLVVAYEVIEHLEQWDAFLSEAARVLKPHGQLIVSTPNKLYYAESRIKTGPNPYHVHEFEVEEFQQALGKHFANVALFLQNHAEGIIFQPVTPEEQADVRVERGAARPEESHFFIAVCARTPQMGAPTFVYVPKTANVLREREQHIQKLEQELETKNAWLAEARAEHSKLVEQFREQKQRLEESNLWARELNGKLAQTGARIEQLQGEVEEKVAWASKLQEELDAKSAELVKCVQLLDRAEATVVERSEWAKRLTAEKEDLEGRVRASLYVKIGRKLGLAPELRKI